MTVTGVIEELGRVDQGDQSSELGKGGYYNDWAEEA
jgi:hypothetical protein